MNNETLTFQSNNEQIIAELRLKLEKAEAEKQAAIEFHLNAFANQIFDQMLKHYKTHKFGPLTMAKDYILKLKENEPTMTLVYVDNGKPFFS
ncbi:hypothetical protein [Vibrio cholerae]|uniref:hypothetical protein n=1 Tax=Vibrio cholerae TaxID=666 RepID=UPI0011D53DDD|nr:hypothetical protein [Vibrio cholerae]MDA5316689.1 hypothetical protein [Vibrio cholerae]TXX76134.1 hypothetical protein FXE96_10005 [Vibrio cholerae]GIA27278.1 hypothetical protein VCSRO130_1427 [Vibrio cholerae]